MNRNSICFLMPAPCLTPTGGFKVVYEYANRLACDGYEVHIVYPSTPDFKNISLKLKGRAILKFFYRQFLRMIFKSWFNIDYRIKKHYTLSLNYNNVTKTDYYVATGVHTAYSLKDYDINLNRCIYLIQDFENWGVSEEYVYNSYQFGFKNVVISNWLAEKVKDAKASFILIKNGFDFEYFKLNIPIESKNKISVSMLYHDSERKGCAYGLKALSIVKEKYPDLKAVFFGTDLRPKNLPEWIEYYQCPDKETHNKIYNESAIYLAPSLQEGWGLTVGEAMICGAAIVCTDTLGFQEMVENDKTALISPIRDSQSLADNIISLIENDDLRIKIAKEGNQAIQKFSWNSSYQQFKSLLNE